MGGYISKKGADGAHKYLTRTNTALAGTAPSSTELPTPNAGDTAQVTEATGKVNQWLYDGTVWVTKGELKTGSELSVLTAVQPVPTATGNATNLSTAFVATDNNTYIVDSQGRGMRLSTAAAVSGSLGTTGYGTLPSTAAVNTLFPNSMIVDNLKFEMHIVDGVMWNARMTNDTGDSITVFWSARLQGSTQDNFVVNNKVMANGAITYADSDTVGGPIYGSTTAHEDLRWVVKVHNTATGALIGWYEYTATSYAIGTTRHALAHLRELF